MDNVLISQYYGCNGGRDAHSGLFTLMEGKNYKLYYFLRFCSPLKRKI